MILKHTFTHHSHSLILAAWEYFSQGHRPPWWGTDLAHTAPPRQVLFDGGLLGGSSHGSWRSGGATLQCQLPPFGPARIVVDSLTPLACASWGEGGSQRKPGKERNPVLKKSKRKSAGLHQGEVVCLVSALERASLVGKNLLPPGNGEAGSHSNAEC